MCIISSSLGQNDIKVAIKSDLSIIVGKLNDTRQNYEDPVDKLVLL